MKILNSSSLATDTDRIFVEGSEHDSMHQGMAATLDKCVEEIKAIQQEAQSIGVSRFARWPMMANDYSAFTEGLDGARSSRWT